MIRKLYLVALAVGLVACGESVVHLDVGSCFDDPHDFSAVSDVDVVPCSEPHDNETVGTFDLPDGDFPGTSTVEDRAYEGCVAAFGAYVGIPYDDSRFIIGWLAPTADSWTIGDREVICFAFDAVEQLVGSIRGRAV